MGNFLKGKETIKKIKMCKACACNLLHFKGNPFLYNTDIFWLSCGHYHWCLEIYDLNFSRDFFQCYFNPVNNCR